MCGSKAGECQEAKGNVMKVPFLNWHRIEQEVEQCAHGNKCNKEAGGFGCCLYKNGTCCGVNGFCW